MIIAIWNLNARRFMERQFHRHRTVIGDGLRQADIHIAHGSCKLGCEKIRSFHVAGILNIRLHEDPIELVFGYANFPPNQLSHKGGSEAFAS